MMDNRDRPYDRIRIILPPGWWTSAPGSLAVDVLGTYVQWGRLRMLFLMSQEGEPLGVIPAMYLEIASDAILDDATAFTSNWDGLPHDPATVAALTGERNRQNKRKWEAK